MEGVKNKTLNCQRTSNYPGHGRKKRLEGSRFSSQRSEGGEGERKKVANKCEEPKGCGKCSLILRALFSLNKLVRIGPAVACAL